MKFSLKAHWHLIGGYLVTISLGINNGLLVLALPVGFITVCLTVVAVMKYRKEVRRARQARADLGLTEDGRIV